MRKLPRGDDNHNATRQRKKNHAYQIGPGLAYRSQALVNDIHPDMAIVEQGITGPHEKDNAEKMPFQFLCEYVTGVKQVAHDHIDKHNCDQPQRHPGYSLTNPFVYSIYPAAQCLKGIHLWFP